MVKITSIDVDLQENSLSSSSSSLLLKMKKITAMLIATLPGQYTSHDLFMCELKCRFQKHYEFSRKICRDVAL